MGSIIIPLGVILYIAASVIGAVMKALNNPPPPPVRPKEGEGYKESDITFQVSEEPSRTLHEEKEPLIQSSYQDELDDWGNLKIKKDEKSKVKAQSSSRFIGKMREGFIMSEIFSEPRSRRPWPNR